MNTEPRYPCLMKLDNNTDDIFLFTGHGIGIRIYPRNKIDLCMYTGWIMDHFIEYHGSVTLSSKNDAQVVISLE